MLIPEELYSQILQVLPIPCVDLLIVDDAGNVLLVRRKYEPAVGQWWFPGGRVLFGELRRDAAKRKLGEECGLSSAKFEELGTFDVFLDLPANRRAHSITTLFRVQTGCTPTIRLDHQSSDARWLSPQQWLKHRLHSFVAGRLEERSNS